MKREGSTVPDNIRFIRMDAADIGNFFNPEELDRIYLNFSDPWPKDRHAHRRLTHVSKLLAYKEIMAPGTALEFKTDNDALFDFSLEQADLAGLSVAAVIRDLHASELAAENIQTEYEEKFAGEGKNINYMKIIF
jgi:tRNA (guanine-N7-)-methyltransferase